MSCTSLFFNQLINVSLILDNVNMKILSVVFALCHERSIQRP